MPRAGLLRKRLTSQGRSGSTTLVPEGQGGYTRVTETATSSVWAALEGVPGQEQIEGGQANATTLYRSRIRYHPDVSPSQSITMVEGGTTRTFNIISSVDPTGRKKEIELLLEEQPPQRAAPRWARSRRRSMAA